MEKTFSLGRVHCLDVESDASAMVERCNLGGALPIGDLPGITHVTSLRERQIVHIA
jgi:hypothetical protein